MSSESLADRLAGEAGELVNSLVPIALEHRVDIADLLAEAAAALRSMEKLQDGTSHPGYVVGIHWMTTAYERICAGEPEAEVMLDYGYGWFAELAAPPAPTEQL